jgi:hypothetical protein
MDAIAALTILDRDGEAIPFARLWAERPVVLVFVRHFG